MKYDKLTERAIYSATRANRGMLLKANRGMLLKAATHLENVMEDYSHRLLAQHEVPELFRLVEYLERLSNRKQIQTFK